MLARVNSDVACELYNVPRTYVITNKFPHYTTGWAYVTEDGCVGYARTREEVLEACEFSNQFLGRTKFFIFASDGYTKARWSFHFAMIAE